ncbi:hypothetical protein SUGI_1027310 [Cryptomeria japonica]|nr:hypothetical protein SUGI_1027310 [Cryptomeria japonica]
MCAGECVLREFSDQPFIQCFLDAKARPGFIVTSLRHAQKLGDLDDQKLLARWSMGIRALKSEGLNFTCMIVNHGSYRNLPYPHLKIWVEKCEFKRAIVRWSEEKKKLWSILQRLTSALPKKRAMCAVVQKGSAGLGSAAGIVHVKGRHGSITYHRQRCSLRHFYRVGAVNVTVQMPPPSQQRSPSHVLPTTMSATRSMQTSSSACHIDPPTIGGDAHEDVPEDLILDAKERIERKKGNTPLDARRRLSDMSKATKARQEKHGQHKLDSGGYMKLVARIGSEFNRAPIEDDKRIAYQQGYSAVADRLRELSGHTQHSSASVTQPANYETPPAHEGPDVHPSSGEHVVGGEQVEHDLGTQPQERDVPHSDDLEGVQHVEVEATQNDVAPSEDPPSLQCPRP